MIPSILTCSGEMFNFTEPEYNVIEIEQIAHALSNLCRFSGHTNRFYSVAQHSLLVASIVPHEFALEALLHDAAVAFVGYVPMPLRLHLPDHQAIEKRVTAAVRHRFGLPKRESSVVRHANRIVLATEKRDLLPVSSSWLSRDNIEPLDKIIEPMTPSAALTLFLATYNCIKKYGIQR